jgi:hypothetical protein
MIAILLAAQLSAEIARGLPADVVAPRAAVIGENTELVRMNRFQQAKICSAASRLQTSFAGPTPATPTLLYRQQDRARTHASKLKDLPPAEACLVGAATQEAAK